ncbi:hypothetical protein B0H14DRAFT_2777075 [Mycena olivaceomarginata]|nr:hypothetical protein B0H14DRAFT_2777075 [Mycena olivaceomarginata]
MGFRDHPGEQSTAFIEELPESLQYPSSPTDIDSFPVEQDVTNDKDGQEEISAFHKVHVIFDDFKSKAKELEKDEVAPDGVESSRPDAETTSQPRPPRTSRLPRRSNNQLNVAELVKKYQDFLPPQGVHYLTKRYLTKRAFPPRIVISESEQEYAPMRPSSPPPNGKAGGSSGAKPSRTKAPSRTRDKPPSRGTANAGSKSTFRKLPTGPGSKASNITKHFERLGRDAERSKTRYAIIRGRRARPVASARAKVEVLDTVKDAIKDESDSSDSSGEADDEGDENVRR